MYSHTTTRSEKSRLDRDLTTLNLNSKMPRMEIARQGTAGSVAWCLLTWKVQASSKKKSGALKRDYLWMHCLQSISDGFQIQKSKMMLHNDVRNISWLGTGVSHRSISRSESKNSRVSRHRDFGKLRVGKGSFMWEVMLIFWRQDSQPQLRVFENGLWLNFWQDGTRCTSIHGLCGMGIDPTNDVELCHVRQVPNSWHQLKGKWQRGVLDLHVSIWVFKAAADHKVWKICWWSSRKKADTSPGTSTWLAQTGWEVASRVGMLIFATFTQAPVALGWNSDATVSLPGQGWLYGLLLRLWQNKDVTSLCQV